MKQYIVMEADGVKKYANAGDGNEIRQLQQDGFTVCLNPDGEHVLETDKDLMRKIQAAGEIK